MYYTIKRRGRKIADRLFVNSNNMSFVRARDFNSLLAFPAPGGDGSSDYYDLAEPGWHRLRRKCIVYATEHTTCNVAVATRYRTADYVSVGTVLSVRVHTGNLSKIALLFSEMDTFDIKDKSLGVVLVDSRGATAYKDYTLGDTFVTVDIQPRGGEYTIGMVSFAVTPQTLAGEQSL